MPSVSVTLRAAWFLTKTTLRAFRSRDWCLVKALEHRLYYLSDDKNLYWLLISITEC